MGLLGSLAVLSLICFSLLPDFKAQSASRSPARALDALLQDYAFRAFVRPKTGIPYDGTVPSNLTGIKVAAIRLRSGSLRKRGVPMYKEFRIPSGVIDKPYVERLVLVYQNLGNWTQRYYPLDGYTYLSSVLGLLAYSASNLSATNLPELDIIASGDPISIAFPDVKSVPDGSIPKCVWFDLDGSVNFSNVLSGNMCETMQQGHFSIVVESIAPAPAPAFPVSPPGVPPNVAPPPPSGKKKKPNSKIWIIVGSVLGGLLLVALLSLFILWVQKYKQRKRMRQMEKAADVGEALHMTAVGNTKAPAAMVTRTQPILENEYVP
ncbi:uncharacterized protein LOC110824369 [Carica papaya]|uniref:uncharacterized protein LOC110824369 n=1 Tax=Carica papaya TaxID=3649 RepID=UPI000B8CBA18|nr:uncharacterized protein LOC110824369 [Carica papaya]